MHRALSLGLALLCLAACPKKEEPARAPPAAPAQPVYPPPTPRIAQAECEFIGDWSPGEVKAAKVIFTVQNEPCLPVPEKPTRHGESVLTTPGKFFTELFVAQGTMGHVCLYGLDERGKVVGAAAWEKNPTKMEGQDDLVFPDIKLTLQKVP
jgi:hypothetical protein